MKEVTRADLLQYLRAIDHSIDYRATVVAIGGSALSLLGIKPVSEDIDLCYQSPNEEDFRSKCEEMAQRLGYRPGQIHTFKGFTMSFMNIPDIVERSKRYKKPFKHIELRVLDAYDIILTKVSRFSARDLEDIESLLKKEEIREEDLKRRFNYLFQEFIPSLEKGRFKKNYEEFNRMFRDKLK